MIYFKCTVSLFLNNDDDKINYGNCELKDSIAPQLLL